MRWEPSQVWVPLEAATVVRIADSSLADMVVAPGTVAAAAAVAIAGVAATAAPEIQAVYTGWYVCPTSVEVTEAVVARVKWDARLGMRLDPSRLEEDPHVEDLLKAVEPPSAGR